jgi:hypothetical protein
MLIERIRQRAGSEALFGPSSGTSGRCLVLQVMSGAAYGAFASIEFDQPGSRAKVLVTLFSWASARSEFLLDGPEARNISTFKLLPDGRLPIPFHTAASDTNAATAQS